MLHECLRYFVLNYIKYSLGSFVLLVIYLFFGEDPVFDVFEVYHSSLWMCLFDLLWKAFGYLTLVFNCIKNSSFLLIYLAFSFTGAQHFRGETSNHENLIHPNSCLHCETAKESLSLITYFSSSMGEGVGLNHL